MRRGAWWLVAVLGIAATAAPAQASSVSIERACGVEDLELGGRCSMNPVFRAGPGEANDVAVGTSLTDDLHVLVSFSDPGSAITAGPGCANLSPNVVVCDSGEHGSPSPIIQLGDGKDKALSRAASLTLIRGGPGADRLTFPPLGGGRLEGGPGNDLLKVRAQGDNDLYGGAGNDRLISAGPAGWTAYLAGGRGRDRLKGGRANETMIGGPGFDTYNGGPGMDTFYAGDGVTETVRCGKGRDFARGDRPDRGVGCEE